MLQGPWTKPAQHRVAFSGRHENVLIGHIGHGINDWQHLVQPLHADRALDSRDTVLSGLARLFQRGNSALEQPQRAGPGNRSRQS